MTINPGILLRAGLGVAALGLAACGSGDSMPAKSTREIIPSITVEGQSAAGQTVTIKRAQIAEPGFLVIHEIVDGKVVAPGSIGHSPLNKGLNVKVKVALSKPVEPGSKLLAMLHNDTGKIGTYEFNVGSTDVDKPTIHGGKPVVKPFPVN